MIESPNFFKSISEADKEHARDSEILVFASHPESGKTNVTRPYALIKSKQIRRTLGGGISPDLAMDEVVRRLLDLNLNFSILVGPSFTLVEVNEGLSFLDYAGAEKPVIYFGEKGWPL